MSSLSVRYNIAAVVVMTVAVVLLVMGDRLWGVVLFAAGAVLAVVAGRYAAREARGPRKLDRDAAQEDSETR